MAKTMSLLKDSYYLSEIRKILVKENNAYKMVFEIQLIVKKWEEA